MYIEYSLSKDDLLKFYMDNHTRLLRYFQKSLCFNLVLIGPYIIFFKNSSVNNSIRILYPFFAILIIVLFRKKFIFFITKKDIEITYSNPKYAYLTELTKLNINDEYISIDTKFGKKVIAINSVKNVYYLESYIYLNTLNGCFLIIPLSAFNTDSDIKEFLYYIKCNDKIEIKSKNQMRIY